MISKNKLPIVLMRVGVFVGTLLLLLFICKFALFFSPFLIAGIIALLIEPIIKFCMNRLKMSRRMSSLIVVTLTVVVLGAIIITGITELSSELIKLTTNIQPAVTKLSSTIDTLSDKFIAWYPNMPEQVANVIESSVLEAVSKVGNLIASFASTIVKLILSVPTMIIYTVMMIMALVFFTKDRVYVIETLEHHIPKAWLTKAVTIGKEIFSSLGTYIKIYTKIILITFIEVFIVYRFIFPKFGIVVPYPLVLSIITAIVDILPVLGVGTILIPWGLIYFIMGHFGWGVLLIGTYIAITVIRNFIEPKLVSDEFGVHPLITLIAMFAGFKLLGVVGLLLGPISLMTLRCIFGKQIERGIFKDLFAEK